LVAGTSCGVGAPDEDLGVAALGGPGAGVAEDRPAVTGVSGTTVAVETLLGSVNDSFAWIAVVRMAFSKSILFSRFFTVPEVTVNFRLVLSDRLSDGSMLLSSSVSRFFESSDELSLTGHTNPVRGVYAGL